MTPRARAESPYGQAEASFAAAALGTLNLLLVASVLLVHGTEARAAWALASGVTLIAMVISLQVRMRRRALLALQQHYLDLGLDSHAAREQARTTLNAWLR